MLLIPNEELEVRIAELVEVDAKYPLKLDVEMEMRMLNMMRYRFELDMDC